MTEKRAKEILSELGNALSRLREALEDADRSRPVLAGRIGCLVCGDD